MDDSFNVSNLTGALNNGPLAAHADSVASKIAKLFALSVVVLVAILGNCLVMAAVYQNSKIQTVTNYLIVNMAVADVFYTLIAVPPLYFEVFQLYKWCFDSHAKRVYFCKVVHFGQYFFMTVSVLTLATIAIDRFFAIAKPMRRIFTKQAFYCIVSSIWIIGGAVAAPMIYVKKIKYDNTSNNYFCDEDWSPAFQDTHQASRTYTLVLFSVVYCVPFFAMSIMYTIICKKLWTRKIPGEQNKQTCKTLLESRKKVVKMLIVVLIAFIVCWLPIQIQSFIWEYDQTVKFSPVTVFVFMFLMRAHSSLSPCIYAMFSANYRAGFKKALCYCCMTKNNDYLIGNDSYTKRMTSYHHVDSNRSHGRHNTLLILKSREMALAKYD